jgi:hypothetical protein
MACSRECRAFQQGIQFGRQWKQLEQKIKHLLLGTIESMLQKKIQHLLVQHEQLFKSLLCAQTHRDMLTHFFTLQQHKKMYKKLMRKINFV